MTKCEFCNFDDKRIFRDFYDKETVNGLYGKGMDTLVDIDDVPDEEKITEYDDQMRIAKTDQGYFLESLVSDREDCDIVQYIPIKYCPKCGRKLIDD